MYPADKHGFPLIAFTFHNMLPQKNMQRFTHSRRDGGGVINVGNSGVSGEHFLGLARRKGRLFEPWFARRGKPPYQTENSAKGDNPTPNSCCTPPLALKEYCLNTSIHGLRYIAEEGRHWTERLLWVCLCLMAVYFASYMSKQVVDRYWSSPTMTVVEGTNHPVSEIPFPAVTICDTNRMRWSRAMDFLQRNLPDASDAAVEAFKTMAEAMNTMEFGDFDKIPLDYPDDPQLLGELRSINLTALMIEVMPHCEQFFVDFCWWRNADFNCCELFELQRTELGFCFSFNSEVSEYNYDNDVLATPRPRRTSGRGQWSGLRVIVNSSLDLPPDEAHPPGIRVLLHSPYSFPADGAHIAGGQWASVEVAAQDTYTTLGVRRLKPQHRGCTYHDEGENKPFSYRVQAHSNCIHQCQRDRAVELCHCTPFYYPPPSNVPYCNVSGMLCLRDKNDIFNFMKPPPGNPYFENDREGMVCSCLPDCDTQEFSINVFVTPLGYDYLPAQESPDEMGSFVFLDIHFASVFVVRYRTDLVFGWLDLLVALGGIVGLFMGSSMLSIAEILYHATLRFWIRFWRDYLRKREDKCSSSPSNGPHWATTTPSTVHPLNLTGISTGWMD